MSGQTVEEMTADAWRALQAARRAAGEPWRDDSDKDIFWLARECEAVRDRCIARIAYEDWKRSRPFVWRWLTYKPEKR